MLITLQYDLEVNRSVIFFHFIYIRDLNNYSTTVYSAAMQKGMTSPRNCSKQTENALSVGIISEMCVRWGGEQKKRAAEYERKQSAKQFKSVDFFSCRIIITIMYYVLTMMGHFQAVRALMYLSTAYSTMSLMSYE